MASRRVNRKYLSKLIIPSGLTDAELPSVVGYCKNVKRWQALLECDGKEWARFLDYDEETEEVLVTHLRSDIHEVTRSVLFTVIFMATKDLPARTKMVSCSTATPFAHCTSDLMWIPESAPPPSIGSARLPHGAKNNEYSYGTFAVEVRCTQRTDEKQLLRKVNRWFGLPSAHPPTSVQLVLVVFVWKFPSRNDGSPNDAKPSRWRLQAQLFSRESWRAGPNNTPVPISGTPIEFGHVHLDETPLDNPCVTHGTHILKLPAHLLYANVPLNGIPPHLKPDQHAPTLNIDLFDILHTLSD